MDEDNTSGSENTGDSDLKEITNKFKNILIKFNYSINNKERTITLNKKENYN